MYGPVVSGLRKPVWVANSEYNAKPIDWAIDLKYGLRDRAWNQYCLHTHRKIQLESYRYLNW